MVIPASSSHPRRVAVPWLALGCFVATALPAQQPITPEQRLIAVGRPAGENAHFPPADTNMVWVPPGTFTMGCTAGDGECFEDEKPPHAVSLSRGFWMDATPVTVGAYRKFTRATGHPMPQPPTFAQADSNPVVNVTWDDAVAYCTWAGGRLPSEAEWEYAARGGAEGWKYPWGNTVGHDQANYEGIEGRDRWSKTSPVGSFDPNGFGLFDMAGNVWEWCGDFYDPQAYSTSPGVDPRGPVAGSLRVVRGGSFAYPTRSLRVSNRGEFSPSGRLNSFGFRCVREAEPGEQAAGQPPAAPVTPLPVTPPPVPTGQPAATVVPPPVTPAPSPAAKPGAGPRPGEKRAFPPVPGEWAWVPAGSFEMGAVLGDGSGFADEQPRHTVTLTRGLWIQVTPVTFAQYRVFAEAAGRPMPHVPNWADDSHPVVGVTWNDAVAFCAWAGGRLPTEAEWERAARGGVAGQRYPWGPDISHDNANFDGTGGRDQWAKSSPVGSFPANGFGLFDMAGNVWQWCADWYDERRYAHSPPVDPKGPAEGKARVVRGGCWTSDPGRLRTSYRFSVDPSDSQVTIGFRCVRDGPP